jgi:hypothetical protein
MLDPEDIRNLIYEARVDIGDADRCVSMDMAPAGGTLHRRLRQVTDALEQLSLTIRE